jgi:uncharacterized protein (DUF58 family)
LAASPPTPPYRRERIAHLAGAAEEIAALADATALRARNLAHTVQPGLHGRRKAGSGDSFWQYRRYMQGDQRHQIDWRRSARHEHLYVREKEWEIAQTVYLWTDLTESMRFRSELALDAKAERGLLLMLALADLLGAAGERVALAGLMAPTTRRPPSRLLAEHLAAEAAHLPLARFPDAEALGRDGMLILLSDFLDPLDEIETALAPLAEIGLKLHLVEILDPAEEELPYAGRTEFRPSEGGAPFLAGRAETLRVAYAERLAAHREGVADLARRFGASLLHHRTDHAAELALLALSAHLMEDDGGIASFSEGAAA